jgi:hypothetical protein
MSMGLDKKAQLFKKKKLKGQCYGPLFYKDYEIMDQNRKKKSYLFNQLYK